MPVYVGIDVHKKYCQATLMSEQGQIMHELRFDNTTEGTNCLVDLAKSVDPHVKAVVEPSANFWIRIYDKLEDEGVEVKLSNPLRTKAIAEARIKTDRIDAKTLAYLLRGDLVAESYVPTRKNRERRALIRHRASLMRMRSRTQEPHPRPPRQTRTLLHLHRPIRKRRPRMVTKPPTPNPRSGDPTIQPTNPRNAQRRSQERRHPNRERRHNRRPSEASHDNAWRRLLRSHGPTIRNRRRTPLQLRRETRQLGRISASSASVRRNELDRPHHQERQQTGPLDSRSMRSIRKQHDPRMREFYERIERKHGHQKAIVAVARKMLAIMYVMLIRNEPYRGENRELTEQKHKRLDTLANSA